MNLLLDTAAVVHDLQNRGAVKLFAKGFFHVTDVINSCNFYISYACGFPIHVNRYAKYSGFSLGRRLMLPICQPDIYAVSVGIVLLHAIQLPDFLQQFLFCQVIGRLESS